jgi:hypothetical protein
MGTTATAQLQILTGQLGIPVPLCYGRVRAKGNQIILSELADKSRVAFFMLGEGEWDGIDRLWINRKRVDFTNASLVHFHPGLDGTLGAGLAATSTGGDQKADQFFTQLPGGLQPLGFSRRAYLALKVPVDPGAPSANLDVLGDYRTTKVRIFDAAGNQTAYQFSKNPAWCILDAIIRTMLKPEGLLNAALNAAEKTRINFPSFVNAATYYATNLGQGPRFDINVAFPNQILVTPLMEQLLLMCRSYIIEDAGQLYLFPDQARVSTFTLTADHYIPGTLQVDEKSIENSANHFVGAFNDLNPPIVSTVGAFGASRASNVVTFTTAAAHPFQLNDYVTSFGFPDASFNFTGQVSGVGSSTQFSVLQVGPNAASGPGSVGIDEALYNQRSTIDDHAQHQLAIGQRGLGLAIMPKKIELDLDYGNNSGERVRRLIWYQKVRSLGDDVSPYKAPFTIRIKARAESVDGGGNALIAQLRGDLIALDASVTAEFAGVYELIEMDFTPAAGNTADPSSGNVSTAMASQYSGSASQNRGDAGTVLLTLLLYESNAYSDAIAIVPGLNSFPTSGGLQDGAGPANSSYQVAVLAGSVQAVDAGTSCTISHPGMLYRFPGVPATPTTAAGVRAYGTSAVAGAAYSMHYFLYLVDPDLRGDNAGASIVLQVTTDRTVAFATPGHLYIDELTTPAPGGGPTFGLNLGHNPW